MSSTIKYSHEKLEPVNYCCQIPFQFIFFFTLHFLSSLPGNGIAALHSVPTAIFCVLHCLQPRECLPENYGGVERTIAYSLALGGDTDTIACMAGAIAGAHYGIEAIPQSWIKCCEGAEDADMNAERLHMLYHQSSQGGGSGTGEQSCEDARERHSKASNGTEKKTGAE